MCFQYHKEHKYSRSHDYSIIYYVSDFQLFRVSIETVSKRYSSDRNRRRVGPLHEAPPAESGGTKLA